MSTVFRGRYIVPACAGLLSVLLLSACGAKGLGLGSEGSEVNGRSGADESSEQDETTAEDPGAADETEEGQPTATPGGEPADQPTPPPESAVDPVATPLAGEPENPPTEVDPIATPPVDEPSDPPTTAMTPTPAVLPQDPEAQTGTGPAPLTNPPTPPPSPPVAPTMATATPTNEPPSTGTAVMPTHGIPMPMQPSLPTPTPATMEYCGDGIVSTGEECDLGDGNGADGCSLECTIDDLDGGVPVEAGTAPEGEE